MWDWVSTNSWWLFIVSALALIILLVIKGPVQGSIEKLASGERSTRIHRLINIIFWTLEGMALIFIAVTGIAIVLSREGIYNVITVPMVQMWFLEHGTRVVIILLVGFVLWYALRRFLPPLVQRSMAKPKRGESREGMKKRADTIQYVFMGLGKILIILLIAFMILSELNVSIGPILAGLGVAGIAVGFGAQYLIRDLIAGVFILMENQYRVGDVARVADIAGLVEDITLRKTVLRDLDGIVHHVPNGEIKVASNFTRHFSRVNLDVSVSYGTDLDHAISVINRVGQELTEDPDWKWRIRTTPQVLRVNKLGDSGIDIKILGDVKPLEQWNIMGELRYRVKKAFDAEGIEIPWPHTKVFFGNSPWEEGKQ
ncbi:MAG: mechanosensitive ion channel family protein [Dehalococcoidia bacterium]|nr:MAG: mechanosensitive ion channel family protein [Dehalococcoidia bacterium]